MVDSWVTGPLNILQQRGHISGGPLLVDSWVTESLYTGVPAAALTSMRWAPVVNGWLSEPLDSPQPYGGFRV